MFLQPNSFRKVQKSFSFKSKPSRLHFGSYGLKSLSPFLFSSAQIEAVRRVISRHIRGFGLITLRVFPFKPVTSKPTKTRMGKGKGSVQFFVCPVSSGQLLFEIRGSFSRQFAFDVLHKASFKLPVPTQFVSFDFRL